MGGQSGAASRPRRTPSLGALLLFVAAFSTPSSAQGQDYWRTDFDKTVVDMDEVVSGGPPKDGIPAIDRPRFVSVEEADDWIEDREPVAIVRMGGEVKAYPLQILIYHEIVNDQVGGEFVSVTYCPLCNTTLAFDRRFDGRLLDFGTTGRLRHSDLIMYDRQTETWWQQATGEGLIGEYAGEELTFVPAPLLSWRDVKEQSPEAMVLSRDTGFDRPYGSNPYVGYDRQGPFPDYFKGKRDHRLPMMERIVALRDGERAWAVPFSELEDHRVAGLRLGTRDVVVFWAPGTASAVDDRRMGKGRDVGSSAVFDARVDERRLTFEPDGDGRFKDRETGSSWNMSGQAIDGELRGTQLNEVAHGNHFWFAWAAFLPDTEVWKG